MKLLVVGGGGREHALVDKLRRDAPEAEIFAAPGNPGTAEIATNLPIAGSDLDRLVDFADSEGVDLTVVGPEGPLAAGVVDLFAARGLPTFGPTRAAARLEASKAFAKRLMRDRRVPTARFEVFDDADRALSHIDALDAPFVVKASGLAAGKGAIVCESREAGRRAVGEIMVEERFGAAGEEVVIEKFLEGEELSVFFLTDGERAVPLAPSRDYKRVGEGDAGPNTGGMGAYAPAGPSAHGPFAPDGERTRAAGREAVVERVRREIALPVLDALHERGTPYRGLLYCGLMLTEEGPQVVEFNCRFGDPEAQVVLPLTTPNLIEPMLAVARGEALGGWRPSAGEAAGPDGAARPDAVIETDAAAGREAAAGPNLTAGPRSALITVLASAGYPGSYQKGKPLRIPGELADRDDLRVYHAGTARRDSTLVTDGGRVLGVVGLGPDLESAAERSREAAARIAFEGMQWRRDIGWHEVAAPVVGGPG